MDNIKKDVSVEEKEHMEIHMKCLSKSTNAKECGDLTVMPMGYAVQMIKETLQAERQKREKVVVNILDLFGDSDKDLTIKGAIIEIAEQITPPSNPTNHDT